MKPFKYMYAMLVTAMVFILLYISFSLYFHFKIEKNVQDVILSETKIKSMERIMSYLKDAETGVRGYAMSGKTFFLDSYNKSLPMIDAELELMPMLLEGNDNEKSIFFFKIRPMINSRLKHLADFRAKIEKDRTAAVEENVATKKGKILMDSIRKNMASLLYLEEKQASGRKFSFFENLENGLFIRLGIMVFIFISCLGAVLTIHKKNVKIGGLINSLEDQNQNLANLVKLRTLELEHTNADLKAKNEGLEKLNAEKNHFLSMAAHDLKNPLAGVASLSRRLEKMIDATKVEKVELVKYISLSAEKMLTLVHSLLDLQTIERGELHKKIEIIDLAKSIKDDLALLKPMAERKNISLEVQLPKEPYFVRTDKNIMSQIVDNLVSNAIKFSPPNKKVSIKVKFLENSHRLEVEDQGPGIKPEEEDRLFKDFARLSAVPTGDESSTGLGLSTSKKFAEMLHADLFFERPNHEGARFVLMFSDWENDLKQQKKTA